nr:BRO family protein [Corynebacterium sp. HMSC072D12]
MATTLHAFTNHEFGTIRTITSGGQVLFYGKDVATALGYANTKDALARHCKGS